MPNNRPPAPPPLATYRPSAERGSAPPQARRGPPPPGHQHGQPRGPAGRQPPPRRRGGVLTFLLGTLVLLVALAGAVTTNVVPQARELGDSLWRWASRVALLGTGDLASALEATFLSTRRGQALPKDRDAWSRWLATSEHARDLVGFSVSEAYTEARRRAGLSTAQA